MTLSETPGAVNRFRKESWRFQTTFQTPLKNLGPFVSAIFSAVEPISDGCVTIDAVALDPRNLKGLLVAHSLETSIAHNWSIVATGPDETAGLLKAALGDWIDFIFLPKPKSFAIYADHDEYTTFFARTKSNHDSIIRRLSAEGFKVVPNYRREF
jgi:hypothetical protein